MQTNFDDLSENEDKANFVERDEEEDIGISQDSDDIAERSLFLPARAIENYAAMRLASPFIPSPMLGRRARRS